MAMALIVLAIGSVSPATSACRTRSAATTQIERFLEPASRRTRWPPANEFQVAEGRRGAAAAAEAHRGPGSPGRRREPNEWLLMAISIGVAARRHRPRHVFLAGATAPPPTASRAASGGLYRLLLNKYYVDELYDAAIVQPIKLLSTGVLWKGVDAALIDGTVNGVGQAVQGTSAVLRRLQTGSVRAYAASLFLGVVLILGWYLWADESGRKRCSDSVTTD